MKQLPVLLGILMCTFVYSQNSYLYLKNGEKISIQDQNVYHTWRGGVYYNEQKKNGKFASSKRMDIDKIERLETLNGVIYQRFQRNEKASPGFYRTMINGNDKKLVFCFWPFGSQRDRLIINYTVLDANDKEIESGAFRESDPEKQSDMFKLIKKYFPACNEVLESIEEYKNIKPATNFYTGRSPEGFMFQTKVFTCD